MLIKFKEPHQDSPLSLSGWRLVLSVFVAYCVLCLVIIAFHAVSHKYAETFLLALSAFNGWVVLEYLWSGVASNIAGRSVYKKSPGGYWFGVSAVFLMGVVMLFVLGSGWFVQIHWASS